MAQQEEKNILKILVEKYLDGTASPQEIEILEAYYALFSEGPEPLQAISEENRISLESQLRLEIEKAIRSSERSTPRLSHPWRVAMAAAATLLIAFVGLFVYQLSMRNSDLTKTGLSETLSVTALEDVSPGGNRAMLVWADGRTISLDERKEGIIIAADEIVYAEGGTVSTLPTDAVASPLTITTPRGGQYQITLPDGTKVWLNAASSLTYPSHFVGTERKVQLKGEAYFEVAPNPKLPFRIESEQQRIEVLGTHFNIMAYPDEPWVSTTLLEGKVKVRQRSAGQWGHSATLKPGQQAQVSISGIRVQKEVDLRAVMAWKQGDFMFKKESLSDIMRRVARWYDVTVSYDPAVDTTQTFSGLVSRSRNISEVLEIMKSTGQVQFRIKDQHITVFP